MGKTKTKRSASNKNTRNIISKSTQTNEEKWGNYIEAKKVKAQLQNVQQKSGKFVAPKKKKFAEELKKRGIKTKNEVNVGKIGKIVRVDW